jgi:hypothetical protein
VWPNEPGLPDGLFTNQTSQFGYILEGLGMENDHLQYFVKKGKFYDNLVYFGMFGPRKIWQP